MVKSLKVHDCNFVNMAKLYGFKNNDIEINGCFFENLSHLILQNPDDFTSTANITNNQFTNYRSTYDPLASYDAMYLDKVSNYTISNNVINGYFNGINIAKSGYGKGDATIENNTIEYAYTGICFYSNQGIIKNNHIYGNYAGVKLLNHSSSGLLGNVNAQNPEETQLIADNERNEVYTSQYSFPKTFKYNVVIDEDNDDSGATADYLLYWDTEVGTMRKVNIHYNCWGENFDAPNDLYPDPYQMYDYSYIWCPPTNGGTPGSSSAYLLYNQAQNQIDNEDYTTAGNTLKSLIAQYPNTNYAQYAIKDLYEVEKLKSSAKSNNDFAALQDYYQNNTTIQNNVILQKMVNFWINRCDIELAHYDEAIAHYESIINQPESLQDSIFAVIDLGDLYLMMEENDKGSKVVGKITTCIPTSEKAHKENRDYLISLLPFNKKMAETENEKSSANTGNLLQNSPNPTQDITTIGYQLENDVREASIVIYDYTGKVIQRINGLSHTAGKNSTEVSLTQLPSGTYFYSLFINGHKLDTKKLIVIH